MPIITPTVTEESVAAYAEALEGLSGFARRVHIDASDGIFSPRKMVPVADVTLPRFADTDIHLMFERPQEVIESVLELGAYTTIFHVESDVDILEMIHCTHEAGLRAGIALLPESQPGDYVQAIEQADYVLVFGGRLGYQGGEIDLEHIQKIAPIKQINSNAEIAWDGGINNTNIWRLVKAGVHVLNVGGFIKNAPKPQDAYATLNQIANPEE